MEIDKYQASILEFLFKKLCVGEDVNSLEFSLSGSFSGRYRAAYAAIGSEENGLNVVFNLPSYSRSVFLAIARTDPTEVARILANLEDYERETSRALGLGEVVVTPDQMRGGATVPFGVILLRTASSLDCAEVPDRSILDEKSTSFYFVVPLTREEYELRKQNGHDALMDEFETKVKDISFN